jgi:hypothetical protein
MAEPIQPSSDENEENPAFDALMIRFARILDYDSGLGFLEDVALNSRVNQWICNE